MIIIKCILLLLDYKSGQAITRQKSQHMNPFDKMPLETHWTIPVKSHWESVNPLEHTADKWNSVGKCHWTSQWFRRCWFLVCNSLPLTRCHLSGACVLLMCSTLYDVDIRHGFNTTCVDIWYASWVVVVVVVAVAVVVVAVAVAAVAVVGITAYSDLCVVNLCSMCIKTNRAPRLHEVLVC